MLAVSLAVTSPYCAQRPARRYVAAQRAPARSQAGGTTVMTAVPTGSDEGVRLLEASRDAVDAAERLFHLARVGVKRAATGPGGLRRHRPRRTGLPGSRPTSRRCGRCWAGQAARGRDRSDRDRAADAQRRLRRVPGAARRRHPDEPGRDRAAGGARRAAREIRRFEEQVGDLIDAGTDAASRRALAEMIAAQPAVTTFGDTGLDETLDRDAHADAPLRRSRGAAPCARVASEEQVHPDEVLSPSSASSACSA